MTRGILDGRNGERDVDETSVLALANGFIVVDLLASAELRQNSRLLILAARRDKDGDRKAEQATTR
jgi:hypothetical protein